MQNVLEQGADFWRWLYTTQFSYHCVHLIYAKVFSIQILLHFSQITPRVCTLVLFSFIVVPHVRARARVCVCTYVSVRSFLPPRASRPRNRYVRAHRDTEKTFKTVIFAKNASFRSYGIICLPPMPPTTLKSQTTDTKGIN